MNLRPGAADLEAARDGTVPDVVVPGLKVLFCGINPSLYSAAVGHHSPARQPVLARPARRGFTPRRLDP